MMRFTRKILFLCLLLLASGCAKGGSDPGAGGDVLSSNDFRITPQEEKLATDLGGVLESPESDQRTMLKKLGFPLDDVILGIWGKYLQEVHLSSMEREEAVARRYHSLQKWHLRELAEFHESDELTGEEKDRFKPALRTAKTYLALMDKASVGNLIFLRQDLDQEERIKSVPKDLVDFLSAQPAFAQPFQMDLPAVMDILHGE